MHSHTPFRTAICFSCFTRAPMFAYICHNLLDRWNCSKYLDNPCLSFFFFFFYGFHMYLLILACLSIVWDHSSRGNRVLRNEVTGLTFSGVSHLLKFCLKFLQATTCMCPTFWHDLVLAFQVSSVNIYYLLANDTVDDIIWYVHFGHTWLET